MSRVLHRRQAAADIAEIWQHMARHQPAAADRWIDDLDQQFSLPARQALIGRQRQEPADGIDVLRVLHASMDIDARFDPGPEAVRSRAVQYASGTNSAGMNAHRLPNC